MKKVACLIVIGLITSQILAIADQSDYAAVHETNTRTQPGYFKNMASNWERGLTNIVSCPLEIPITVIKYHKEDKGLAGVRHAAGFADGIVRTAARGISGVWDIVVSFVPGDQGGALVKPATLFGKQE